MTVHMPAPSGPEPASDAGLVPDRSALPAPEVMDAAYAAYEEAGGGQPPNQLAFLAAVVAGVVTDRGLQDAARLLARCGPADCVCDHGKGFHDISSGGQRTKCLTATGHTGAPCGCKRYVAKESG